MAAKEKNGGMEMERFTMTGDRHFENRKGTELA